MAESDRPIPAETLLLILILDAQLEGTTRRLLYRPNGSDMIYEYNLTDHLGNTRITFGDSDADGDADILQENHYYPFGMAMTMSTASSAAPSNEYLYNGKELQTELGLDWYDYGARMYDASIGRWNGVDALAERYGSWSPYNYTMGNPIRLIDPDGNQVLDPFSGRTPIENQIGSRLKFDPFSNRSYSDFNPSYFAIGNDGEPEKVNSKEKSYMGNTLYDLTGVDIIRGPSWKQRLRNFGKKLLEPGEQLLWTGIGFFNAAGSDLLLGAGRIDPNDPRVPEHVKKAYLAGQRGGDATAIAIGSLEILVGGTAEVVTVGGASPVAVPLVGHGAVVTGVASSNLINNRLNSRQHGKGERKRTRNPDGTPNPFKGWRPDPNNPKRILGKDVNGKNTSKAKPEGFDEWWNSK